MPVVINELEINPEAPPKSDGSSRSANNQEGPPSIKSDTLREIEKAINRKQDRTHRLIAC